MSLRAKRGKPIFWIRKTRTEVVFLFDFFRESKKTEFIEFCNIVISFDIEVKSWRIGKPGSQRILITLLNPDWSFKLQL